MSKSAKITIQSPLEATREGFGSFNTGQHICIDLPEGETTISVRTSFGKKITFAFVQYGESAGCVDIKQSDVEGQRAVLYTKGGDLFHHARSEELPTVVAVVLQD